MKISKGQNNRCGIFLYYDKQGVVDDYVMYLLQSIRPFLARLLIVVNGEVNEEASKKFRGVADEVLERRNEGFDVGGYREGIFHIGLDKLAEYDETLLFNYTFFGPLYPFSEMFDKMDGMDLDFWGITRHYKVEVDPYGVNRYGYLPEHIQSHFMALRKEFIKSRDYIDFITELKNPTSYVESICEYETIFTKHFEDLGYRWDTYVDTSEYEGYSYCPIMFYIKDMFIKHRCPIIKRRSFFTDYNDFLLNGCGEASIDAYEYMREHIDYDVNMIWDNLLRLENISEIAKVMHFNYMLPANEKYVVTGAGKQAVFIYLENTRHYDGYVKYIDNIPDTCDLYFVGTKEALSDVKGNKKPERDYVECCIERNLYIEAYTKFESYKDNYDYAAMLVMSDVEIEKPYSNYDSWQYRDWENLIGTECIVNNVIASFEENERLGMLVPPVPNHGILFEKQADGWQNSFEEVSRFLNNNGTHVSCKKQEAPQAPFGGSFWLRTKAFPRLSGKSVDVRDNIFRMALVYLVQEQGYYSGICYNNEFAAIETTNLDYVMRELNKAVFEKYGPNFHNVVVNRIRNNQMYGDAHVAGRREKIKVLTVNILQKIMPRKLYVKARLRYMKMRGW